MRSAAVQVVATATLAALPGGGGLGRIITAGFGTYDTPRWSPGAALVAALALLVEGVLVTAERLLDPMRRTAPQRQVAGAAASPPTPSRREGDPRADDGLTTSRPEAPDASGDPSVPGPRQPNCTDT